MCLFLERLRMYVCISADIWLQLLLHLVASSIILYHWCFRAHIAGTMPRPPMYDAPETSATDAQALHMLDTLHEVVDNPYGDAHDVDSASAADGSEPLLSLPACAPPATASPGNEAGLVELGFHLHNIRDAAQHVTHQLAPLFKPPPPLPTDRPKPPPPLPKPPPPLPTAHLPLSTAGQEQPSHLPYWDTHADGASEHVFLTELRRQLAPPLKSPPSLRPAGRELSLPQPAGRQLDPPVKSPPPPPPPPGREPPGREPPPPPPAGQEPPPADGASEHVLLSVEDLPELRRRGHGLLGVLHDEARALTDKFANADHEAIGVQANLTTEWPNWKLYIANHKLAPELIGPGVKAFTVEFIDGVKDSNRGGRPRLDLVIRYVNNAYCRLHPGTLRKNDAQPRFFPASAPEPVAHESSSPASAPEPAAYEWRRPGVDWIFSPDRAKLVPQSDRLGKANVWQALQRIPRELIPDIGSGAWLDITCGKHLRWWLWICNLGNHTRTVIGAGIHTAHLAMRVNHEAMFKFTRIDGSECAFTLRGNGLQIRELRV